MARRELAVGDPAPDFSLPSTEGRKISLKEFRGKKKVVLYFYPKDDTPGCTKEACGFRDEKAAFDRDGAVILGVSFDSPESHEKFSGKFGLSFPLLSDEKKETARAYGVYKMKTLYGRKYKGIERSTFLIGKDGRIALIFRKVKVEDHIREVSEALSEVS